ncbi:nucleoside-diphosphate sugar epimerase/dehydratase [Pseudomonas berkeleyensis]|uniref:Polysaccharide biosynthesis protein n=1 Tax=Pseudomonas berkeleyensis TaxID=2726956 RepID=A0A7G5DHZ1_9PSED|nr:nucleoside-diphosphate sugar epimerase/dehydratase [Pseudomonas berkeleyensis]QMV61366.1 polysaccharide biosynthesis protein [Pseudomonas berkeleyensis]WSO36795.1 nucleoside-diphosphate sugar epimerase/dehydratase [Pseudomonas berkeleyensis]
MSNSIDRVRQVLLELPRGRKRLLQVMVDVLLLWLALWLAFFVRLGTSVLIDPFGEYLWLFVAAPATAIPLFVRFGLYRAVLRYFSSAALMTIFNAISLSALLLAVVIYLIQPEELMPRSVVFIYWAISLLFVGGLRLLMRQYFSGELFPPGRQSVQSVKVAIYGAGAAGNQLLSALRMSHSMKPVAFIDDDVSLGGRVIAGVKVYAPKHVGRMIEETGARELLLAIPSASRARRREILAALECHPLHVRSIPGFMDLASGRVKVEDLQEVDIADLLGRDAVPPRQDLFQRCIKDQVVLVTGAGGSIGSELCRQILASGARTLLLFEHSEFNLYSIHGELQQRIDRESLPIKLVPILGSIRNVERLFDILQTWRVNTVYHAAAYKHVPMVEHNVAEGVLNNLVGTLNAAQASIKAGVANFVLISTDKAVRPTNVMGSTKRLAEMVLQALSRESAPLLFGDESGVHHVNKTRFTMVRFGNVLGSSGSVIPLFREQIKQGGPVTVTHPNITRYFMTIPEAAQLVIQAGSLGLGGDVFVLDMGEPVKIADLAEKMIRLSGLSVRDECNPHGDIAIEFTGLRPGEKLYEELLIGEDVKPTEHPMIMRAEEDMLPWEGLKTRLQGLLDAVDEDDYARVRLLLREVVHGYVPEGEIVDWIHLRNRER